mgnify:CR=1 FL=1
MDAIEDIKNRLSIEDVISRYVELKRAGRNFRGLSPFNSEKTPSFMVSPEKQIWHDFSSSKGGNMFSFVMEMEGIDFKSALELLARQAGIDLSQYRTSQSGQRGKQKERLSQALELAAKFYQAHFKQNKTALEYIFKNRKFNKDVVLQFRIGYSPSNGNALTKFLLEKGFTATELKQAGLGNQLRGGLRDMFRGRIMIPLMDPFGAVIGFTARILEEDQTPTGGAPKYINTPATLLYDKSRHIFGLHLAKEAIRKSGYVVVVEGNMDVIASHQAGIKQVVATAGTAMTEPHFKLLTRLTHDVRIAFDQDKAGLAAAERTIPLAAKTDISLSIITVSEGKDPDELIKKAPARWQQVIDKPQYALDWLIERHRAQLDITTAQGKRTLSDIVLNVVSRLSDSVEQDHYITQLAELIGVSPDALRTKLAQTNNRQQSTVVRKTARPEQINRAAAEAIKSQNHFLAIMLLQPGLRMYLKTLTTDMLPEEAAKHLLELLKTHPKINLAMMTSKSTNADGVIGADVQPSNTYEIYDVRAAQSATPQASTSNDSGSGFAPKQGIAIRDFVQILVLLYEELYESLELLDLRYEAAQLQARLIREYVKTQKTELAKAMRETGEAPTLLEQAKQLDQLLKTVRIK